MRMMNQRQINILELFRNNKGVYITGALLAEEYGVSIRTIRNDINAINDYLVSKDKDIIFSQNKKGYFYEEGKENLETIINDSDVRTNDIVLLLLSSSKPLSIAELSRRVYVSESRISSDLKKIREMLKDYNLHLMTKNGISINGLEENKRLLITKGEILPYAAHGQALKEFVVNEDEISRIRDKVLSVFVEEEYDVPDLMVRNLLIHIYINILRMKENNLISEFGKGSVPCKERTIAEKIYSKLSGFYGFTYNEEEIGYLAYVLQSRNYDSSQVIEQSTQDVVLDLLNAIKEKQGIDFTQDEDLIMSLVLHYGPLKTRMDNKTLLINPMIESIRKNNSLAYEMAILAGKYFSGDSSPLSEDEIGYLAIHFMMALDRLNTDKRKKAILVICSSTRGNGLLLKYSLGKFLNDPSTLIDVCSTGELNSYDPEKYDAVFSTIDDRSIIPKGAVKINYFLTDEDYKKIRKKLDYEQTQSQIEKLFAKERFLRMTNADKEKVIRELVGVSIEYGSSDPRLLESVLEREKLGYTEMGSLIAIPHPNELFDNPSLISVGILDKPITWKDKKVQIVFLLNIRKGERKQLETIFSFLAELAASEEISRKLISSKSYESFMKMIKEYMEDLSDE